VASSDPAPAVVRLAFPPLPALLGTVRLVVGVVARKAGVDEEGVEDLKVAISETCAVAVNGLEGAGLSTPIELDLIEEADRFGVEVRDAAPAGERGAAVPPDGEVDDRQFGLALVDALVDGLDDIRLPGGGHRTRFWLPRARTELPPPLT
jgi:anti-sigma regulatory factor (Ser/Thr protein kinase)